MGDESVPKIITTDTINLFFNCISLISNRNSFRVLFDEIASVHFIWKKYIYILALKMVSPGNQHCVHFIGTLSFPIHRVKWRHRIYGYKTVAILWV